MQNKPPINWTTTLFITLNHAAALLGTGILLYFGLTKIATFILALALWAITGISITAGYHRLFAHRSYVACRPIQWFFACFGAANFQGSILEWSADHRYHHRYTDTDRDPYSIKKGFWHAHILWLFRLDESKRDFSVTPDLQANSIVQCQHRFILTFMITFGYLLPVAIASLWGDPLGGLFIAGALRIVVGHHATWAINSVCHYFGKGHYVDQSAKDNWLTAFFTWGEGFHNFHHKFPIDYRNGIRWFHYDPTKWLIKSLSWLGLTKQLKTVQQTHIIGYKLKFQQAEMCKRLTQATGEIKETLADCYHNLYEQLQSKIQTIKDTEISIKDLQERIRLATNTPEDHLTLANLERNLQKRWKELQMQLATWQRFSKTLATAL